MRVFILMHINETLDIEFLFQIHIQRDSEHLFHYRLNKTLQGLGLGCFWTGNKRRIGLERVMAPACVGDEEEGVQRRRGKEG